jgi:uncharacterized cupin superfamily protein
MTATMTAEKIEGAAIAAMALAEQDPIPGIDDRAIGARERASWRNGDGTIETGVWECDAGRFRAEFEAYGELFTVVSGEVVCTPDDGGAPFTLRPGDSVTFPRGWTGEWDVRAPLRKVYAIWKVW